MTGIRKLILSLSCLAVGGALAWCGRLSDGAVELIMWVMAIGIGGNVGEHFARRGHP